MKLSLLVLVAFVLCVVSGWYVPNKRRNYVDTVAYPVPFNRLSSSYTSAYPLTIANVNQEYSESIATLCRSVGFKPDQEYANYYTVSPSSSLTTSTQKFAGVTPVNNANSALTSSNTVSVGGGYKVLNA